MQFRCIFILSADKERLPNRRVFAEMIEDKVRNPGYQAVTAFNIRQAVGDQPLGINVDEPSRQAKIVNGYVYSYGFSPSSFDMRVDLPDKISGRSAQVVIAACAG